MTAALAMRNEDQAMRERKCIVTGELRDEKQLIRFVVGPDGDAVAEPTDQILKAGAKVTPAFP